jgi:hypothetical protein
VNLIDLFEQRRISTINGVVDFSFYNAVVVEVRISAETLPMISIAQARG